MWISAIFHGRLQDQSDHPPSTSRYYQKGIQRPCTIHFLNTSSSTDQRYTMASIHDQLQCCLLFPRTQQRHQHTRTQTRDPRRRQTKHCRSQHKKQGRLFQLIRILQWKINMSDKRNCHQPQILTVQNPHSWCH